MDSTLEFLTEPPEIYWPPELVSCFRKHCGLGLALYVACGACCSGGQAARNRAWLVRYATAAVAETPRNARYLRLIAQGSNDLCGVDPAWFTETPQLGGEIYVSRGQTNALGRLAYCYRTPGTPHYRSANALATIRQAFSGVVDHVSRDGKFTWEQLMNSYGYEGQEHEHAWRVEPLIMALIWAGEYLPENEFQATENAVERAAAWLAAHPLLQTNNRGVVWLAVTTLCGIYFERPDWVAAANKHWQTLIPAVVLDDGECGEHTRQYAGGGPDSNYSYTGWGYVYLWHLLTNEREADERLLTAMRWFTAYNTLSGCPTVSGASVRRFYACPGGIQDLLPALEKFSHTEPFFATVAECVLTTKETYHPIFGGHIVSPLIWALLARGVESRPAADPEWYAEFTGLYERPNVQYALVRRAYSTGVTFRGIPRSDTSCGLRGMQTFAWANEYPILLHTDTQCSSTRIVDTDIDTANTDVSEVDDRPEVVLARGERGGAQYGELVTITCRRAQLWTVYAYTRAAAVVVHGNNRNGCLLSRWVMNRQFVPKPQLDSSAQVVSFAARQGRVHCLLGQLTLTTNDDAYVAVVETPGSLAAFGFSDDAFAFEPHDPDTMEICFRDTSGRYRLLLNKVLDDAGNVNRCAAARLMPMPPQHSTAPTP